MNYDSYRPEKYQNQEYRFTKVKESVNKNSFHGNNPYENKFKKQVSFQIPQESAMSNNGNDFGQYLKGYYQEVIQQNQALKHKIDLCESSIKYLNQKIKVRDTQNIELKQQNQSKSKKIQELKLQNQQLHKKYKQLKINYKTLDADYNLAQERETKERDLRIQIQSEKNYLVERYQNYEIQLQKLERENEHLHKRLKSLEQENFKQESKNFKKQLQIKASQLQQLKKTNIKLKESNTSEINKYTTLTQNIKKLQQTIANLEQDKINLTKELQSHKIQKIKILKQSKELNTSNQINIKKYDQINQKYLDLISQNENLCSINDRFEEVLRKTSEEKIILEAEIKTLRNLLKNNNKKQNEIYFSNINNNKTRKSAQIIDSQSDFEAKRELFKDKSDRKIGKIKNRSKFSDSFNKHQSSIRLIKNRSKETSKNNSRNNSKNVSRILDNQTNRELQKLIQKFEKIKANRSLKKR